MKFSSQLLSILLLFCSTTHTVGPIKHIFIDINILITTCTKEASKMVGIINSMRYTAQVGHTPCKSDFFKALKTVPSLSNDHTYNDDLIMPSVLCDWLLGLQPNHEILHKIHRHLEASRYSNIETTIFKNISSMMLNPKHFIETQYVIKEIVKVIQLLIKAGYQVYIIGNWDKESEPMLIKLIQSQNFAGIKNYYFSHKAQALKASPEYFTQLLEHYNLLKHECLCIDIEKQHSQQARNFGLHTILLHTANSNQLKSELIRHAIRI